MLTEKEIQSFKDKVIEEVNKQFCLDEMSEWSAICKVGCRFDIHPQTILNWMKRVDKGKELYGAGAKLPAKKRHRVGKYGAAVRSEVLDRVHELMRVKGETPWEASRQVSYEYGIHMNTIKRWKCEWDDVQRVERQRRVETKSGAEPVVKPEQKPASVARSVKSGGSTVPGVPPLVKDGGDVDDADLRQKVLLLEKANASLTDNNIVIRRVIEFYEKIISGEIRNY